MELFLRNIGGVTVSQLAEFDEIIDVRSPSEFSVDHIPGAINYPVLNDEERARVGTIYKQVSSFDARKIGAAIIARNAARHLEEHFIHRPRDWHPLVYCWRGGKRSGAMTHILSQVGWSAQQLEGGYKAYRHAVQDALEILPRQFRWRVVCGLTGSGKSRLLHALHGVGAQILDLEGLTRHRGSVLGSMPNESQPSQKYFDSLMFAELKKFDLKRTVYVEAESKKIGDLRVPQAMIDVMWQSDCIRLEVGLMSRVRLLMEEYAHFLTDISTLYPRLDCLIGLHSKEIVGCWKVLAEQNKWEDLVGELLIKHYDPAYTRSTLKNYERYGQGIVLRTNDLSDQAMHLLALEVITSESASV
jgi:tRNA 2-selenouridine synthase